jgi:hypothetical protein
MCHTPAPMGNRRDHPPGPPHPPGRAHLPARPAAHALPGGAGRPAPPGADPRAAPEADLVVLLCLRALAARRRQQPEPPLGLQPRLPRPAHRAARRRSARALRHAPAHRLPRLSPPPVGQLQPDLRRGLPHLAPTRAPEAPLAGARVPGLRGAHPPEVPPDPPAPGLQPRVPGRVATLGLAGRHRRRHPPKSGHPLADGGLQVRHRGRPRPPARQRAAAAAPGPGPA